MPYRYVAINDAGERVAGLLEVESEEAAEQRLWEAKLTIVSLRRVGSLRAFSFQEQMPTLFGVKSQDVIYFASQLTTLIEAGLSVMASLRVIRQQVKKVAFRSAIDRIIADINEGQTLSEACGRHAKVFPTLLLRLIRVGEETGRLDVMLRRATEYLEKRRATVKRVRGALTYPALVFLMSLGSAYVLLTYSLPNLVQLFREFHAGLPIYTRLVIALGDFAGAYGQFVFLAFLIIAGSLFAYARTEAGKRRLDYAILRLPVIGDIVLKISLGRLAGTARMLIGAGLSLTEMFDLLIETSETTPIKEPLRQIRNDMLTGQQLSEAFGKHPIFPSLFPDILRVGEETGTLEASLGTLATVYEQDATSSLDRAIGLLEPTLIIVIGGIVGFISVTIITTMYSILPSIK